MQFTINGRCYTVAVSSRPLILDGQPCKAKFDPTSQRILLSDQLPKYERRKELFHELLHAWQNEHGEAAGSEAVARQVGDMVDSAMEEFINQGGDERLRALAPEDESKSRKDIQALVGPTTMLCGHCGAPMAVGSIAKTDPFWNENTAGWSVDRGLACEVCDCVTTWREVSTADGMPTGTILPHPAPRILCGREAGNWIAAHSDACRVLVA